MEYQPSLITLVCHLPSKLHWRAIMEAMAKAASEATGSLEFGIFKFTEAA
jgi:hypothetical protein